MRIFLILSFSFFIFHSVSAQYYYKDFWNNQALTKEFTILKTEKIRTIAIKSYEDDGEPSVGFFCEKKFDRNYSRSEMISRSNISSQSLLLTNYNKKGQIISTIDSTTSDVNMSEYTYDENDRVKTITTRTRADDDHNGGLAETREYSYDTQGRLSKMTRKKNGVEYSTTSFTIDEKGNVIEEVETGKNLSRKYFYYYDDKNRLTDVVHYNDIARRLLPDYIYEYNSTGQIKQMISTAEGANNYFIWRYTYNDKRLRETERCLTKEKRLMGSVQYIYK